MLDDGGSLMNFEVTYIGRIDVSADENEVYDHDAEVQRVFEATATELTRLGLTDAILSGSIRTGDVEISCNLDAEDPREAVNKVWENVDSAVRSSLHAAGVHTPEWDGRQVSLTFHSLNVADLADCTVA
jgi:hypothetical protein